MGKSQKMEKKQAHQRTPLLCLRKISFIIVINLFVGVNEMHVKNIIVTVSVRVSATVRVSLVWFVSTNFFGASSVAS